MSDASGRVADSTGNWVDWLAPAWSRPFLRLARFDRPIGSWLLMLPCWWSAALAAGVARDVKQLPAMLGLAFSWGALMGFAVLLGRLPAAAFVLYAGSIAWVIGYDTIYAHQDREDDALIGVKSTARLFGDSTPVMLTLFYGLAVMLIGVAIFLCGGGWLAWAGLFAFALHLVRQTRMIDIDDGALCLKLFKSNRDA